MEPLLSVVVPLHDVERYAADCLDSILKSTYRRLEVVVVDDGSIDRSAAIAERYARADSRVRLVHQRNAGPGAARNTGVRHARGELITFADSDDTVPRDSYRRMVETLGVTASDFVVGAMTKQVSGSYRVPAWMIAMHRRERRGVTIDEAPDLITNIFAWNKVFRRSFWDTVGLSFPEGVSYEDHVPMTAAYLAARSFDVVPDVVYRWRTREDAMSITQRKHELPNLVDALDAKRGVSALLAQRGSPAVSSRWHPRMFNDLRPYFDQVPGAAIEYWRALQEGVREFVDDVPQRAFGEVRVRLRVLCWLAANSRRVDLEAVLRQLSPSTPGRAGLVRRGGYDVLDLDLARDVPEELLRLAQADRHVRARLTGGEAVDGAVSVRGAVQLLGVCDRGQRPEVSLVLYDRHHRREVVVATTTRAATNGHQPPGTPRPVVFEATFGVDRLQPPAGPEGAARGRVTSVWAVEVRALLDGQQIQGPFTGHSSGAISSWPSAGSDLLVARWQAGPGLELAGRST